MIKKCRPFITIIPGNKFFQRKEKIDLKRERKKYTRQRITTKQKSKNQSRSVIQK